ncbi:hypothetical protein UFOVP1365_53 [uncultured Caudovirales phage]|uniref:Uncharacterized protein n=1 Tax=uncultured Caudovirales phage TaxID=2100421 RepID=A0A6J5S4Y8_9CAUD|nr:hypothetical protein UFOVP1365_53 [uncultured Caudovirales phage]
MGCASAHDISGFYINCNFEFIYMSKSAPSVEIVKKMLKKLRAEVDRPKTQVEQAKLLARLVSVKR